MKELKELDETLEWAQSSPIKEFADNIQEVGYFPFFSVGSGGSLTAASFWSLVHESITGFPSKYGTPLDLVALPSVQPYAVGLVSARGGNPDIVRALRIASRGESKGLITLTYAKSSNLIKESQRYRSAKVVSFEPPIKKDGFLATNSLVASLIHIYRAYCTAFGFEPKIVPKLLEEVKWRINPNTSTYSILYAGWSIVAAKDIESKLVEAGIANVHLSDLRNFAHGRHHWLERHGGSTAIIALETPEWEQLFGNTLGLLPPTVEVVHLRASQEGPLGAVELVVDGLRLIGQIASLQGLDPGRPNVPEYGRKLYYLATSRNDKRGQKPSTDLILRRKFGVSAVHWSQDVLETSKECLRTYLERLNTSRFRSVVFDYDETLCPAESRFGILPATMSDALTRIIENGIIVGIASGRGRSLGVSLKESLDCSHWDKVIVGYYSGSHVLKLNAGVPVKKRPAPSHLMEFLDLLQKHPLISQLCRIEIATHQISLTPFRKVSLTLVQELVQELSTKRNSLDISVKRSSHAIDVLGPQVSKMSVVKACLADVKKSGQSGETLCIGDSGTWCGNDFHLLSSPLSLSVAECPKHSLWAWNLSAPGHLGPDATLDYFKAMQFKNGLFSVNVKELVGGIK